MRRHLLLCVGGARNQNVKTHFLTFKLFILLCFLFLVHNRQCLDSKSLVESTVDKEAVKLQLPHVYETVFFGNNYTLGTDCTVTNHLFV